MDKLKLFVLGQKSSNPDDWDAWRDTAIVVAYSAEEALAICPFKPATEIVLTRPMILSESPSCATEYT